MWTVGTLARTMWRDLLYLVNHMQQNTMQSTDTSFDVVGNTEGRTTYYEHETGTDQNKNGTITAITQIYYQEILILHKEKSTQGKQQVSQILEEMVSL